MYGMILAAGRGERMRPLTDTVPKPLLKVGDKSLIEHHLHHLARIGIKKIVINVCHLADKIMRVVGDGQAYGVTIVYSVEDTLLDTGGGIFNALPHLGEAPFLVVNADVYTAYPFEQLLQVSCAKAHLVLVDNPPHHRHGDFYLKDGQVVAEGDMRLTYSGIGVYHPELFVDCRQGAFPLAPLLQKAVQQDKVSAEHYQGCWVDVGTPERWRELNI